MAFFIIFFFSPLPFLAASRVRPLTTRWPSFWTPHAEFASQKGELPFSSFRNHFPHLLLEPWSQDLMRSHHCLPTLYLKMASPSHLAAFIHIRVYITLPVLLHVWTLRPDDCPPVTAERIPAPSSNAFEYQKPFCVHSDCINETISNMCNHGYGGQIKYLSRVHVRLVIIIIIIQHAGPQTVFTPWLPNRPPTFCHSYRRTRYPLVSI